MPDVVLIADSCCDLPAGLVAELGLPMVHFPYALDGVDRLDDLGVTLPHAAFYAKMREGAEASTAQIPITAYAAEFRAAAEAGLPAVLLAFLSQLSGSFEAAHTAREQVLAETPGADVTIVDSRSASIAEGLLVLEASRRVADGAGKEELLAWVSGVLPRLNAWFTIEDLEHLRRGGRISNVAAAAGGMLDIKPVLRIDAEGRLVVAKSVRGRGKSLKALADVVTERIDADGGAPTLVLGHADSAEDAERLLALISERTQVGEVVRANIGPVIGAHTGPGMVAVAFFGSER